MNYDEIKRRCRGVAEMVAEGRMADAETEVGALLDGGATIQDLLSNISRDAIRDIEAHRKEKA